MIRSVYESITFGASLECFPIIFGQFLMILRFDEKKFYFVQMTVQEYGVYFASSFQFSHAWEKCVSSSSENVWSILRTCHDYESIPLVLHDNFYMHSHIIWPLHFKENAKKLPLWLSENPFLQRIFAVIWLFHATWHNLHKNLFILQYKTFEVSHDIILPSQVVAQY